ncbi:hypothetical protein E2C01_025576 [Portunus trituberculatus]|uniref:Uncharacterized protein n=1 Tax=Portunus trituberculatus TaxID=210409 RepID=A0A5B7EGA5_PORTR|nr:hypothetical protein [Portunus trituberculatus]
MLLPVFPQNQVILVLHEVVRQDVPRGRPGWRSILRRLFTHHMDHTFTPPDPLALGATVLSQPTTPALAWRPLPGSISQCPSLPRVCPSVLPTLPSRHPLPLRRHCATKYTVGLASRRSTCRE